MDAIEREKAVAARAAAALVQSGDLVGLGTGSTVEHLLVALAERALPIRCVATSPRTADAATARGLEVIEFDSIERLDITIDGADQVDPAGWLIKGAGGALTREKIVASASARFVVIVSSDKVVDRLTPPVPIELLRFGLPATLAALGSVRVRDASSPDGGCIADYLGAFDDPAELARRLAATPGVVEHGLFEPALTAEIIIARGEEIERRNPSVS